MQASFLGERAAKLFNRVPALEIETCRAVVYSSANLFQPKHMSVPDILANFRPSRHQSNSSFFANLPRLIADEQVENTRAENIVFTTRQKEELYQRKERHKISRPTASKLDVPNCNHH